MPTSDTADTRLVAGALSGNQGAIEELITRYQHKAIAIALAAGVRRDSVPDVLQDACVRAFRALPQLEAYGSYGSWFLAIVRNVARRSLREARPGAAAEDFDRLADRSRESHAEAIERSEFNERLRQEVDRLPEGIREAIFLYYFEGESVRGVAAALGTTAPAVKNRLQKGRDLLRDRLWRQLRDSLRDMLPSARESRRAARHLSLVVMTSLPAAWGTAAGASSGAPPAATRAGTGAAAAARLFTPLQGIALMSAKHIAASVIVCAVLFSLGFANGYRDRASASPPPPAAPPVAAVADPLPAIAPASLAPAREPAAAAASPLVQPPEPAPEPARLGAVRAHVAWEIDDGPVAGAIVLVRHRDSSPRLEEFLGVTDERGIAEIDGIAPGEVEVLADRAAPRDRRRSRTRIAAGETAEVLLRLRQGIAVDGIVVDTASVPVAGAEVRVSEAELDCLYGHTVAHSGPDGTFRIDGVERGRYVSARAAGWAPSIQYSILGEPGSKQSLRLVLSGAGGTVMGHVADGSGAAVAGALVFVGSREFHGATTARAAPVSARTDADGAFEAPGIPPGPVPVAVRALGYGPQEVTVDVAAAGTSRVVVTLPLGVAIEGTVLGPDGAAAPAAEVVVGAAESRSPLAPDDLLVTRLRTDESGRYRLEGLAAGTITVAVSAKGLGKARRTVEAAPGDVVALDIKLSGSLEIAGRVVLEDGTPVKGWGVHGPGLTWQVTDTEGRFTYRDLDDRSYTIEVTERDHQVPCARVEGVRAGGDELAITVLEADRPRSFASGTVVDPDGRRVRGARVGCYLADGSIVASARTGFFGGFRVGPMPAGTYCFGASIDDLPSVWTDDLTVARGETLSLGEIRLRRPGFLDLEFRSHSGRTSEGLSLFVRDAAGRYALRRALPLPSQSAPLIPGRHTVTVKGSGFEFAREVEIREGERTAVEIDLDGVR